MPPQTRNPLSDRDLRVSGLKALERELGPVNAARFLVLAAEDPIQDFVKWSSERYRGATVDELFDRAAANWANGEGGQP